MGYFGASMSALSNLFGYRNPAPVVYRPAARNEIEAAMRLIVGTEGRVATDEQVLDFLSFAVARGIDVNDTWVAEAGGKIEFAILPVISPGRTMLLFSPSKLPRRNAAEIVTNLVKAVHEHCAGRGVRLSQILLDPKDKAVPQAYMAAGYQSLAELAYLQVKVRGTEPLPALPPGWRLISYSAENHAIFAETVGKSYEGSLDCPALNGVRDVEDVIAGHKGTGDFDPRLWYVVVENGQPLGTLLLNRSAGNTSVELVYIGVPDAHRGRGVGDFLLQWSLAVTGLEQREYLSLAVDQMNIPALRLYYRHGFARIGSRTALMCRIPEVLTSTVLVAEGASAQG